MTVAAADLRGSASALLDALDPADVAELLARRVDRQGLLDALCELGAQADAHLRRRGVEVPPELHGTLLLACLSLRPDAHGVKGRVDRVAETYQRFRPLAGADPRDVLPVAADHPDDLEALTPLLARARTVRDGLQAAGVADPSFFVEPVALAVAAGPVAAADLVGAARTVLERGARLARDHAESGRPAPVPTASLPVIGNADFLMRLAGYLLAVSAPEPVPDPGSELGRLERVATRIGAEIAAAMSRPTGFRARFGAAEPDVLAGVDQYVTSLGEAVGGARAGRLLRRAYSVRTRHARPHRSEPVAHAPEDVLHVPDTTARHAELHELAARLVAALFERAEPALREPLVDWLCGRRQPDRQDDLVGLLRMLRVGVYRMAEYVDGHETPPDPTGLSARERAAVLAHLTASVDPGDLVGERRVDAHRLLHLGLPPLWTRRRAATRMLTARRRVRPARGDTPDRRTALSRAATRAPLQFLRTVNDHPAGRCCPPGADTAPGRSPTDELVACPHRPWGEIGVVDTYRTVAADTEQLSPESVRKYYARYAGPDGELLLGVRPRLRPEDC